MSLKPIHYNPRKAAIFDRHRAFDAMREAGISPMKEFCDTVQEIKRQEKVECALLEAGEMIGRDYQDQAILDITERKYLGSVPDIRELIADHLTRRKLEGDNYGRITSYDRKMAEGIRRAFNLEQEK